MNLGPVMLDLNGLEVTAEEKEILRHPQVGGLILFSRNYQTPAQLHDLLRQIREASGKRHLLVAVDHEGGRVQRFREGFTHIPAMGTIGALYQESPSKAQALAEQAGWLMATELRAYDIDFSFAPVLDLNKGISEVIGNRSFHQDTNIVIELAKAHINGIKNAGMSAVGKHFPGHGSVAADSHVAIPIDSRNYEEIMAEDALPFMELCQDYIDGIMPAHVIYDQVDKNPAGFSDFWLQTTLRKKLNFQGAIFSDDLSMQGASCIGNMTERAQRALAVGCDCILVCNSRVDACTVLESLERLAIKINNDNIQRLLKFVGRGTVSRNELHKSVAWQTAVKNLSAIKSTLSA